MHPNVESHTPYKFQKSWERPLLYRLDFIVTRQPDRRLLRNVTARRPLLSKSESDHNLVTVDIQLLRRLVPNRRKREMKGRRAIDLQQLMASLQLQRACTKRATPLPPVDGMATVFAEAMLLAAANIAPTCKAQSRIGGVVCWRGSQGGFSFGVASDRPLTTDG